MQGDITAAPQARPIRTRRQKTKGAEWDPAWPAQPDHGGSDGEELSAESSDSELEDLVGDARLERLAAELKELPVSSLYPDIAAAGLEVVHACVCCRFFY